MEIKEFNNNSLLALSSITTISNFTINPYKGCSFACKYCYAALNKNVKKYGKWGSFVIIKKNISNLLESEIKNKIIPFINNSNLNKNNYTSNNYNNTTNNNYNNNINNNYNKNTYNNHSYDFNNSHNIKNKLVKQNQTKQSINSNYRVIIGSNTDPYQPVELQYKSTHNIISILNKSNIGIFLMTKSPLVINDLELISKNQNHEICFTINSSNIINNLEKSYPLEERVKTIFTLFKNNINIYIHIGPFIPYFTDLNEIKTILKKYFKNCKNKIKINIEPLNLLNSNPEFTKSLKQLSSENFVKLIKIYSNKDNYYSYYNKLKSNLEILFNFPFIKRVKILKREFNNYYSTDSNLI